MKILVDENVDNRIKPVLEDQFLQISTTYEEGLTSKSAKEIIEYCKEENCAILTHDDDFLSIKEEKDLEVAVILIPQRIRFREMKKRVKQLENPGTENIFL